MRSSKAVSVGRLEPADADAVVAVMRAALRTTNAKDYSAAYIEDFASSLTADEILRRARSVHFYTARAGGRVVGCGAVAPLMEREDECELQSLFVSPDEQGRGVGKLLVEALESDEFCLRAKRIELSSSITAVGFYRALGYRFKGGEAVLNEKLGYPMEKFR